MNKQNSYQDLIVWQKSMDLVVLVYKLTERFPSTEQYGLTSQMRRAAVSIPSNIAEGSRRTGEDVKRFLRISYGSGSELETQIDVSKRLSFGKKEDYTKVNPLLTEVMKILNVMIHK